MNLSNLTDLVGNVGFTLNFFPFTFGLVAYILTSIGLYGLAKRRMINHAWLAWVPVANVWILGSLSDQYRYVAKGQVKNKRKILLGLSIANAVLSVIVVSAGIFTLVDAATDFIFSTAAGDELILSMFSGVLGLLGMALLMLPLAIVTTVFHYMALYDLYLSCDPENAVMFLVLSIVIHVTEPFFVLCCRNKDKGMPPRRPRPERVPPYEAQPREPEPAARPAEPAMIPEDTSVRDEAERPEETPAEAETPAEDEKTPAAEEKAEDTPENPA